MFTIVNHLFVLLSKADSHHIHSTAVSNNRDRTTFVHGQCICFDRVSFVCSLAQTKYCIRVLPALLIDFLLFPSLLSIERHYISQLRKMC